MTKILFLGCNTDQVPYLKYLKVRGLTIIGTDMNTEAPGRQFCDRFYQIGYDNAAALIQIGKDEEFTSDDKVFTAAAQFANWGAAKFCAFFNIPSPSPETIEVCLDKAKFYRSFQSENIPISDTTYIENESELRSSLSQYPRDARFYLKSDFSKNPLYVYTFEITRVPFSDINWKKDRYFRNVYILQKEFSGKSLRLNLYGDRFNVFDFESQDLITEYHDQLNQFGIITTLKNFMQIMGLGDWLVKFDVILNRDSYVVLDIGLDPPFRMARWAQKHGIDFSKHYIDQYIGEGVTYPLQLDGV